MYAYSDVITAVVDTNVLASGALTSRSAATAVVAAAIAAAFHLVLPAVILQELTHTLRSPSFARRPSPQLACRLMSRLETAVLLTPLTVSVIGVATHPEDDRILATALSGQAPYLITGDKPLSGLAVYQDVTILSPAHFLDLLASRRTA